MNFLNQNPPIYDQDRPQDNHLNTENSTPLDFKGIGALRHQSLTHTKQLTEVQEREQQDTSVQHASINTCEQQHPMCPDSNIDQTQQTDRQEGDEEAEEVGDMQADAQDTEDRPCHTPVKKTTVQFLKDVGVKNPTDEAVNIALNKIEVVEQVKHCSIDIKKLIFEKRIGGCGTRHTQKSGIGREIRLCRHDVFPTDKYKNRKKTSTRRRMADYKRRAVDEFLRRDDNSYTLPDKKHYRKDHGVPIVALVDSMRNLHRKFVVETGMTLSFATFCKARDKRTVKTSVFLKRSVCLCKPHANMGMLLEAVEGLPIRTSQLLLWSNQQVADALDAHPSPFVTFKEWEKVKRWYGTGKKKKKVYHTQITKVTLSKQMFKIKFEKELKSFRKHQARVEAQYQAIKTLKANLPPGHVICQMDYAENWPTGFFAEIQSAFFGKDQITLHPMVVYARPGDLKKEDEEIAGPEQEASKADGDPQQPTTEPLKNFNFVGVSEVNKHSFPTTFSFLVHLMHEIRQLVPELKHLHLITDSPSSQYRNRFACDMLQRAANIFGIRITWNWLEAGHGKGPCDGIGGALKGLADRTVKICGAIQTVDEFVQELQPRTVKLKLMKVEKSTIEINQEMIGKWNSSPVNGITKMHHATVHEEELFLRTTSCYEDCCFTDDLRPQCPGWKKQAKTAKKTTEKRVQSESESESASDSDSEVEEEREEREAEEDLAGENDSAVMEVQFSSEEDEDEDCAHNSHRTIRRKKKKMTVKPMEKKDVENTDLDSDNETDDEVEDEPDSERDQRHDEKIAEIRRRGGFVNELNSDSESSSDEWALSENMSLQWLKEKGFAPPLSTNL